MTNVKLIRVGMTFLCCVTLVTLLVFFEFNHHVVTERAFDVHTTTNLQMERTSDLHMEKVDDIHTERAADFHMKKADDIHTERAADFHTEKVADLHKDREIPVFIVTPALSKPLPLNFSQVRSSEEFTASSVCEVPPGGFKAWNKGVVSSFTPEVAAACSKVLSEDTGEVSRVKRAMATWKNNISDEGIIKRVKNCSWLKESFANNLYNSELEKAFPIAFTFVVYNSPQQVLRLLRLLYRPHNSYCIHPDEKSPYKNFFRSVADCFDNVIIASKLENVVWRHYTILAAQMNCMNDLLERRHTSLHKWKYVINLCGKELPLVTNREIVSRLMRLKGSSSIVTEPCGNNTQMIKRIKYPTRLNGDKTGVYTVKSVWLKNRPFDLSLYHKSSSYNTISYQFANFLAYNSTSKKVYEYFKMCSNSEEHYYATLYMMHGVPGGFNKEIPKEYYFSVEEAYWTVSRPVEKWRNYKCRGKLIHNVCIITAADLSNVARITNVLFFNKYFVDLDHTVMTCMEERIVKRNKFEYQAECGTRHVQARVPGRV